MTKLLQQIEEVGTSLSQTFTSEQSLVKSLDDALGDLDRRLLREVRRVATEHQARRGAIHKELRALAGSIGMFRPPRDAGTLKQINGRQYDARRRRRGVLYRRDAGELVRGT